MTWILRTCLTAVVVAVSGFTAYSLLLAPTTQGQLPADNQRPVAPQSPEGYPAARSGPEKVAALGRLEPQGETIDIGAPLNDRLGRLLVQQGQDVEAGDILAYLESYAERLAERNYAESQLHDAEARHAAEIAYGQASIEEAKSRLKQLEELRPLDLQAQEAKVRQLAADLVVAKQDLERFESLRQRVVSQQDVEHQRLQVHRAEEELTSAKAGLAKLKASYSTNLLTARTQVATAQASLVRAQTAIQLASLQQNLELAQARLDRTILRAPSQGKVLRLITHPGETTGTRPILKLGNTQQMYAVAEVYETDVALVRVGQWATVTSPALPEALTGSVEQVGHMIAKNDVLNVDPAANTDARVVEVKIRLDHSGMAERLINLQVNVVIHLTDHMARTP